MLFLWLSSSWKVLCWHLPETQLMSYCTISLKILAQCAKMNFMRVERHLCIDWIPNIELPILHRRWKRYSKSNQNEFWGLYQVKKEKIEIEIEPKFWKKMTYMIRFFQLKNSFNTYIRVWHLTVTPISNKVHEI